MRDDHWRIVTASAGKTMPSEHNPGMPDLRSWDDVSRQIVRDDHLAHAHSEEPERPRSQTRVVPVPRVAWRIRRRITDGCR